MAQPQPLSPWADLSIKGALAASTALSGFGIWSTFADGIAHANPAAYAGCGIITVAFAACEVGAVALALQITKDGATVARGALFAFCTLANVLAGHYGIDAINTRLVAPQRAPFEATLASAEAQLSTAKNGLSALEVDQAAERATFEHNVEADRAAAPGAVTARAHTTADARDTMMTRQHADHQADETEVATAQRARDSATAELAKAPKGFDWIQQWAVAALLESLKGVLAWVAAPRSRKLAAGQVSTIAPAMVRTLTDAELEAAWESLGDHRSLNTTIWHERRRRGSKAA